MEIKTESACFDRQTNLDLELVHFNLFFSFKQPTQDIK